MPTYIWSALDSSGQKVFREIQANNSNESKQVLVDEGCTELILVQDEIMDAANAAFPKKIEILGEKITITTRERIKHFGKGSPTLFSAILSAFSQGKQMVALIVILFVFGLYRGSTLSFPLLAFSLLAWILFVVAVSLPGIYYGRLHKAADWAEWNQVLKIVTSLQNLGKIHFIKVPAPELARYRAKALAGLGRLPEALELYKNFEGQPGCPTWLFHAFVAGIYDTAKQHDHALEHNLISLKEQPTPSMYIDYANRMLRYKSDPATARLALAEAEKSTIPDIATPFYLRCQGVLAYLEKDYVSAKNALESALEIMERTRNQPYRDGHISVTRAYLSCVLVRLGDLKSAGDQFEKARSYLEATGETELIAECATALSPSRS